MIAPDLHNTLEYFGSSLDHSCLNIVSVPYPCIGTCTSQPSNGSQVSKDIFSFANVHYITSSFILILSFKEKFNFPHFQTLRLQHIALIFFSYFVNYFYLIFEIHNSNYCERCTAYFFPTDGRWKQFVFP